MLSDQYWHDFDFVRFMFDLSSLIAIWAPLSQVRQMTVNIEVNFEVHSVKWAKVRSLIFPPVPSTSLCNNGTGRLSSIPTLPF